MAHTKEPWRSHSSVVTLNNQGGFDLRGAPNAEENAARIVACVNACAGIPNGNLEKGGVLETVIKERDELLQALKHIEFATKPEPDDGSYHENAWSLAVDAIAKVEG